MLNGKRVGETKAAMVVRYQSIWLLLGGILYNLHHERAAQPAVMSVAT